MVELECSYCEKPFKRDIGSTRNKKNQYCSIRCKDIHTGILNRGKNHPRWNPKLSNEDRYNNRKYPEYLRWRDSVYKRDNFTCKCCNDNKGGNLVAHHILNYSEHDKLRTALSNGITLCKNCHKAFHDSYGYTNNDKQQLKAFIDNYNMTIPSEAC